MCSNECVEREVTVYKGKMGMFDFIVVPSVLYGCKAQVIHKNVKKRVNVLKCKCVEDNMWYE